MIQALGRLFRTWAITALVLMGGTAGAQALLGEASKQAQETVEKTVEKAKKAAATEGKKDAYQLLAGAITVVTALAGLLPKILDSASLVSRRRRDLQRIEDLTGLMQKLHAEIHLSETTLEHLKTQLEAELMTAAVSLERARSQQNALQELLHQRRQDLNLRQRLFLLFPALGLRAGLAHFLTYTVLSLGLALTCLSGLGDGDDFLIDTLVVNKGWIFLPVACALAWPLQRWAMAERRRWREAHPDSPPEDLGLPLWQRPLLLFRPVGWQAWTAHLLTYWLYADLLVGLISVPFDGDMTSPVLILTTLTFLGMLAPLRTWALTQRWRTLRERQAQRPAAADPPLTLAAA